MKKSITAKKVTNINYQGPYTFNLTGITYSQSYATSETKVLTRDDIKAWNKKCINEENKNTKRVNEVK